MHSVCTNKHIALEAIAVLGMHTYPSVQRLDAHNPLLGLDLALVLELVAQNLEQLLTIVEDDRVPMTDP